MRAQRAPAAAIGRREPGRQRDPTRQAATRARREAR